MRAFCCTCAYRRSRQRRCSRAECRGVPWPSTTEIRLPRSLGTRYRAALFQGAVVQELVDEINMRQLPAASQQHAVASSSIATACNSMTTARKKSTDIGVQLHSSRRRWMRRGIGGSSSTSPRIPSWGSTGRPLAWWNTNLCGG
jgi:hypothetical protein